MAAGNCFANEMANAMSIPFINWQSGYINCPGNEVWYKFTANVTDAHPKGSPGWYTICTNSIGYTNFDTVLYLYDSSGNQIAYNDDAEGGLQSHINARLTKYQTYYIRLKGYGSATGFYHIRVSYLSDDHGDSVSTASSISGVYYTDASVEGYLHSEGDMDYFSFVPARDCVMKIYTDGSTDTTGILYNECGSVLYNTQTSSLPPIGAPYYGSDNDNGNGNFAIYARLDAYKFYYIAVRHSVQGQTGNYTLKTQFLRDYRPKQNTTTNPPHPDLMKYVYWQPDEIPDVGINNRESTRFLIFLNKNSSAHWYMQFDSNSSKSPMSRERIIDGVAQTTIEVGEDILLGIANATIPTSILITITKNLTDYIKASVEYSHSLPNLYNQISNDGFIQGRYYYRYAYDVFLQNYFIKNKVDYSQYYENYFYGEDYKKGVFLEANIYK